MWETVTTHRGRVTWSPSDLLHLPDRAVARARSWSPFRHGGRPGRWNDDRRATRTRSLVEATRVVGRVRREAGDVALDRVDQIEGRRRVVHMPAGQGVSDDHARSVDAQMELLPATRTAASMFHGGPFTFTYNREPGTVDDQMDGGARGDATQREVEPLPLSASATSASQTTLPVRASSATIFASAVLRMILSL